MRLYDAHVSDSAQTAPAASAQRPRGPSLPTLETFSAFKSRPFTYLWINTLGFALVQATQRFAFVWLVLELGRGSGAAGLVSFALGIPVLFMTIPAGVLADRMDRRTLVLASQLAAVAVTLAAGIIVFVGAMTTGVALILALGVGATVAVGLPVRNAIVPTVVERGRLMNAIVMMSMSMNVSQIIGPAFGGLAIAIWGIGGAFIAQGVVLLIGTAALIPLAVPRARAAAENRAPIEDLREGLHFVWNHRGIRTLILLLCGSSMFMIGPFTALLPLIAKEDLGKEALAASLLFAFMGAGMMIGSLALASMPGLRNKGGWFLGSMIMGGLILAGIGLSPWYPLTATLMFVGGLGGGFFMNLNQTLVQANTPHELMGRVVSIHTLGFQGLGPFGALLAGALAIALTAPIWMAIGGAIAAAMALLTLLTQPSLRRMS